MAFFSLRLSLSLGSHRLSFSSRSCMSNLLRMQTGPPPRLYSPLIFSRFFFFMSLPIFMPVPLCQYRFHHTLTPLFQSFFFSLFRAFRLYQALHLSLFCRRFCFCLSVCLCDAFKYQKSSAKEPQYDLFPHLQ